MRGSLVKMSHWRPLLIISIEKQLTWQVCDEQELIKGGRRRLICAPWAHLSAISYFNRNQSERVLKFPCPSQLCSERWPFNRAMLLRLNIHEASCWRSLCSCSPLSVEPSELEQNKTTNYAIHLFISHTCQRKVPPDDAGGLHKSFSFQLAQSYSI